MVFAAGAVDHRAPAAYVEQRPAGAADCRVVHVRVPAARVDCRQRALAPYERARSAAMKPTPVRRIARCAPVHRRHHRQLREEQLEIDARAHSAVRRADARRLGQHQHADGRHAAHSRRSGLRPPFMVVEMGAFKTGSIRRLVPADAAVRRPDHRGRRHAPRALRIARRDRPRQERAGRGDAARRPRWSCNADSPGALRIARGVDDRRVLLYGETSTEDLGDPASSRSRSPSRARRSCCGPPIATYRCFTPLLGRPIILNLAGAFTLATALGVDPEVTSRRCAR